MPKAIDFSQVQGNILLPYTRANCSRLLFFRFDEDPDALTKAREWVRELSGLVTYHGAPPSRRSSSRGSSKRGSSKTEDDARPGQRFVRDDRGRSVEDEKGPWYNVGFTAKGLEVLGFDPFTVKYLPSEFVQGMRARAGRLGDLVRSAYEERVHAVVMVYTYDEEVHRHGCLVGADAFEWRPLSPDRIKDLEFAAYAALEEPVSHLPSSAAVTHVRELDQDTYKLVHDQGHSVTTDVEYFGFQDGISQPIIKGVPNTTHKPSEADSDPEILLLGCPAGGARPDTRAELALEHLKHGSFLVIRKLAQDVEGFREDLEREARRLPGMDGRQLAELMMGRRQGGDSLVEPGPGGSNDFDYEADPEGRRCPFQSHARRANPRDGRSRIRRLMRRAMPYSRYRNRVEEQGLLFQAYNANLESQFEFVQRLWMNSGVENYGLSRDRDPIAGEPAPEGSPEEDRGTFSFTSPNDEKAHTVTGLGSHVSFQWGDYFLVPSRATLEELSQDATKPLAEYEQRVKGESQARARDILARWLDDSRIGRRIWAQVRARGGALRVDRRDEDVVLVGTADLIAPVLRDDGSRYSVADQGRSMSDTSGLFYLGLDPKDPVYQRESKASFAVIPGWRSDKFKRDGLDAARFAARALHAANDEENKAQLEQLERDTQELCFAFLGVSVTSAVADRDLPGDPEHGYIQVEQLAAFVLSGLTPKLFGVPQPSVRGTLALFVPTSGYIFFPFPEEVWLETADRAAKGVSSYLADLFDERDRRKTGTRYPDRAEYIHRDVPRPPEAEWEKKLDETLSALEEVYHDPHHDEPGWTREDSIRTMAGIISGMLVASFKIFRDGISDCAKKFDLGTRIRVRPEIVSRAPFEALAEQGLSMPNILYRRSEIGTHKIGPATVKKNDFVLVCQGSAMAEGGDDRWFYGDRTPTKDEDVLAPHFCPGYRAADTILGTMSTILLSGNLGIQNLRRVDDSGLLLQYDWEPASQMVKIAKKVGAARQAEKAEKAKQAAARRKRR